jgi:hypothetical protein
MRRSNWAVAVLLAAGLIGSASIVSRAADEKAASETKTATSTEKSAKKAKSVKLFKPYSEMTSLSDDQKMKIADIRKKTNEERRAIEQKESEAIMALLNPDQKAEAEKLTASTKKPAMKKEAGAAKAADGAEK